MISQRDTDERFISLAVDLVKLLNRHRQCCSWQVTRQALLMARYVIQSSVARRIANMAQDFVVDGGMTKAYVTPEGPPLAAPHNNALLSEQVDAIRGTGI